MTLFVTSITHLLMFYQYIPTNEQNSGFTHDILLNSDTSIIILNIKQVLLNTVAILDVSKS